MNRELTSALGAMPDVLVTRPGRQRKDGHPLGHSNLGTIGLTVISARPRFSGSEVDLVHATQHVAPFVKRWPTVLTVHDLYLLDRSDEYQTLKRVVMPPIYRRSLHAADLIMCVSAHTMNQLCEQIPSLSDKSIVVRLAAPSDVLLAPAVQPRGVQLEQFALFVGDDHPRKGLRLLLEAFAMLGGRVGVRLVIAGSGHISSENRQLAAKLEADGLLSSIARPSDNELRWLYESATVVCVPSVDEGFGFPASEAEALGVPLLVSACPALRESGGPSAIVVRGGAREWAEAISEQVTSGVVSPRNPRATRSWADVATETVAAYRNLLRR